MSDIALRVENLGKQYRIGMPVTRYRTLREAISERVNTSLHRLHKDDGQAGRIKSIFFGKGADHLISTKEMNPLPGLKPRVSGLWHDLD